MIGKLQQYKWYGIEGLDIITNEQGVESIKKCATTEVRQVCTQEASRFDIKRPSKKKIGYDTNNTKETWQP